MAKTVLTEEERKARKRAADKAYRERKKAEKLAAEAAAQSTPEADVKTSTPEVAAVAPKKAKAKTETSDSPKAQKVVESFTKTFGFPVRLYWNRKIENDNSSCARPNTELTFEKIGEKDGEELYRVRRGKRNFFTTASELVEQEG